MTKPPAPALHAPPDEEGSQASAGRDARAPSYWLEYVLPAALVCVSIVTTTAIGARFMQNFRDGLPPVASEDDLWPWPWLLHDPHRFLLGWPFSASLLGILLIHEFGHVFACRRHRIRCTLPWVLPAPTLSGTVGAVIQIRSQIPDRRALVDVGAYGPVAGYAASLVVVLNGLLLSTAAIDPNPPGLIDFGRPLTIRLLAAVAQWMHPGLPPLAAANWHPVLVAGWIGLLITALNLIPAGQLDGGHILYALWPRLHRRLRFVVPAALILCGIFYWLGWIFWGLLLFLPAMRHPKVADAVPLDRKRLWLCAIALAIFALTFSKEPFSGSSVMHYFRP